MYLSSPTSRSLLSYIQSDNTCPKAAKEIASRTSVDRTLRAPEILSKIIAASYWDDDGGKAEWLGLRDVLSLALTCKAFLEPALDRLWRRQTTLFNLIKTLPDDSWAEYDGHYRGPDGSQQLLIVSIPLISEHQGLKLLKEYETCAPPY